MTCSRKIGPFDCCSVVHGDCLELINALPARNLADSRCFDLIFADPPYGIMKADWDDIYPAGIERQFLKFGRTVAMTPGQWALNQCIMSMRDEFIGIIAARNLNGMTFSPLGFGNWIPVVIAGKPSKGQDAFEFTVSGGKPSHPSPKPIEFMRKLIERLTDEGETVFDPYCGSGTTAVACSELGRHFLTCDIRADYCDQARERLARIEAQPRLFEPKAEQLSLA